MLRFLLFLLLGNLACVAPSQMISPTATEALNGFTLSPTEVTLQYMATEPTTAWETIAAGMERRIVYPNDELSLQMVVIRIDPQLFHFRAHADPGAPKTVGEWRDLYSAAELIINANFFDPAYQILGLLISDAVVYGNPYTTRGGTFYVGADQRTVSMVYNLDSPYQGGDYWQAVQAFPMLVYNGQAIYFNENDVRPSRRTVIAMDWDGKVLIMATPVFGLGLYPLGQYLAQSDLNLMHAFNLDGGGSTLMWVKPSQYTLASVDAVPAILAVYPN
ncbi:hypothetical protein MASR2M15_07550 [Anaerolineales bacterium]